jgi:hypothetical protein
LLSVRDFTCTWKDCQANFFSPYQVLKVLDFISYLCCVCLFMSRMHGFGSAIKKRDFSLPV